MELLDLLPSDVRIFDVLGEEGQVIATTHRLGGRGAVLLEVAIVRLVEEPGPDGTMVKMPVYENRHEVAFTTAEQLDTPIRVMRGAQLAR